MDLDTLWQLLEPRLSSIELKLDKANGRSNKNCWNIRAIWTVFGGAWTLLLLYLRGDIGGE